MNTAEAKNPGGRPRKYAPGDKPLRLSVYASDDDERILKMAAASQGKTLVDFVTETSLARARMILAGQGLRTPEYMAELAATRRRNDEQGWFDDDPAGSGLWANNRVSAKATQEEVA